MPVEDALGNVHGIEEEGLAGLRRLGIDQVDRVNQPVSPFALEVSRVPYPKYCRPARLLPSRA